MEEIPLEYFEKAFDWLTHQEEVVPDEYAIVGASKGAEIALLLGSRYKQVRAVVGLSPSSVVWQGIPSNRLRIGKNPKSSLSFEGKGLPYIPSSLSSKDWIAILTLRLRRIAEKDLENCLKFHNVIIPIEKTNGPILLISAKEDRVWPSTLMANQIIKRLSDSEFKYKYEHIAYDKGHSILMMTKSTWRTVFDFLEGQFTCII